MATIYWFVLIAFYRYDAESENVKRLEETCETYQNEIKELKVNTSAQYSDLVVEYDNVRNYNQQLQNTIEKIRTEKDSIKSELNNISSLNDIKSITKLLDKNLNSTDDWRLFEEAFNNADKDFMKNLKSKHPNLTPNDLKLCAYLRLNLSSKEIAPLLNISHRSVEVKRYRLRKKMGLEHESGLTEYILEL